MPHDEEPLAAPRVLKTDLFGSITLLGDRAVPRIRRDTRAARWWLRPLARRLAAREARVLAVLDAVEGTPSLLAWQAGILDREWIAGAPMHQANAPDAAYFRAALRLLRRLHQAGVAHNDTAKEPNWLVQSDGTPALIDFQVALYSPRRGRVFRALAREDLRHLLKHKRSYRPESLTRRQRAMLATPAAHTRIWHATGKRVYLWLTRRVLGWADREGAGDRRL